MVPLPSNVMESWMNARSFYVVVELSIVESMFTRHKHEIWKHGCTIRVSYPIHIRYDTAYLIIHPRIGFSMRPVSYWPDTRIRYISNTCPASCVFLPHLKINRYNGNFLHNGNTFLTFFRRDEDRDFFYFFFLGFFYLPYTLAGRIVPYLSFRIRVSWQIASTLSYPTVSMYRLIGFVVWKGWGDTSCNYGQKRWLELPSCLSNLPASKSNIMVCEISRV